MASIAHADDQVHMNKFDMYTWTGTYGVSHDGFPKTMYLDGTYRSGIDETPTQYPSIIDSDAVEHFNPERINMSGPMYLKTGYVNPAPDAMYPARKYEYDDGSTTWVRPAFVGTTLKPGRGFVERVLGHDWFIFVLIVIVLFLILGKSQLKFLKGR
jgi:hypothetical protein